MKYRSYLFLFFAILNVCCLQAQGLLSEKKIFTQQDTLRGSITPERIWWDLTYYHLELEVVPDEKFITGKNTITYTVLSEYQILQVDLQAPLTISKVTQDGKDLEVVHVGNAHFVQLIKKQEIGNSESIIVHYQGNPKEAIRAPWDGGFSWKKDNLVKCSMYERYEKANIELAESEKKEALELSKHALEKASAFSAEKDKADADEKE
jgi:hypothetical protein